MSLVVETGFGAANAESYVSAAETDAYLDSIGETAALTAWRSRSSAEQEAILRKATRHIERVYAHRFVGTRATNDQALAWPRWRAETRDGRWIDGDGIPAELKRACFEAARRIAAGTTLISDADGTGTVRRELVKAGSAEVETEYASPASSSGTAQAQRYPEIELEIMPLLQAGGRIRRA